MSTTFTPVLRVGAYWFKREDLYGLRHARGGKVRAFDAMIRAANPAGVCTSGVASSPQVIAVAELAALYGIRCRVHVAAVAKPTRETDLARALGAEIVPVPPVAWFNVLNARARDDAKARGWLHIPFWADVPAMVEQTAVQADALPAMVPPTSVVVVPVGSGATLAGVLRGLRGRLPVRAVQVGADPTRRLDRLYGGPGWEDEPLTWQKVPDKMPPLPDLEGVPLDPGYEGLAAQFVPRGGGVLWVTGNRDAVAAGLPDPVAEPGWEVTPSA